MTQRNLCLTALCLLLLHPVHSGGQTSLFAGSSFEHEVTQRWGYEFEVEHRQLLGSGIENRVLLLFAVNRLLTNNFSMTPGLRLTPFYGEDPSELRLFTDLNYSRALGQGPFALEFRLRSQYERPFTSEQFVPEVAVRPRIGLVWQSSDALDWVLEYETRYRFDEVDGIVQHRYTSGLEVDVSTRISVDVFFRIEREPQDHGDPATVPTFGVYLLYVLPDRRDIDWEYRSPFGRSLLW